jgi:hypothetical protein
MVDYNSALLYAGQNYGNPNAVVTGTTVSKGEEYELSANPVPGLLLSVNASHTTSTISDIGGSFQGFFNNVIALLNGPAGDLEIFGGNSLTLRQFFQDYGLPQYALVIATQGTQVPELRPWSVRSTADYSFQGGCLKGFHIGGSYRWSGKEITGYPVVVNSSTGVTSYDVGDPYWGKPIGAIDAWVGYTRKLHYHGLVWSSQVNVRNLFASDELIPVTVNPDGSLGGMRIPEPRTISWTNTISY